MTTGKWRVYGKTGIRLADELLENPGKVLDDVRDAVRNHQLIKTKNGQPAEHVNIRFVNLPQKTGIRHIRSDDINKFVTVEGILRKTTEVRPRIVNAVFRCPGGHMTEKDRVTGSSSSLKVVRRTDAHSKNLN